MGALGCVEGEVVTGAIRLARLAGNADRQLRAVALALGREYALDQLDHSVNLRPREIRNQPGRFALDEFDQPGGHVAGVDRLGRNPPGAGVTGSFAIFSTIVKVNSLNCAARSVVHGTPDSAMAFSASSLDFSQASGTRSAPMTEM